MTEVAAATAASRRRTRLRSARARARRGGRRCAAGAPGGRGGPDGRRAPRLRGAGGSRQEPPARQDARRRPGTAAAARGRVCDGSPGPSGKRLRAAGYLIEGCSQLSVYSVTKRLRRWTAATG